MGILDELIKKNEFPIIFIGSGISKRYLKNYPSWLELLEKIWKEIEKYEGEEKRNFYSKLNYISEKLEREKIEDKDFHVNVEMASSIEKRIKNLYYENKFKIENLTQEETYKNKINPFKKYLANIFSSNELISPNSEELKEFKNMLKKSRVILTTNYDTFIEDSFGDNEREILKKYIGQKGFFKGGTGYCELYKIHGSIEEPNSIIITEEDYREYDKNSILITSKIVSSLLNSPIILIGYSLTDLNIKNIIKNFSNSLDEKEKSLLSKRIIIINWKKDEENIIEEIITDSSLNCKYTVIKTDNYLEVFKKIGKINQGATPAEISKFEHIIKELIVQRGKKGELEQVFVNLVTKEELDNIKNIGNSNIAIAVGNKAILVKSPSVLDYLEDYFKEEDNIEIEIQLRFLAQQSNSIAFPALRYLTENNIDNSNLLDNEKSKLRERIKKLKKYNIKNSSYKILLKYNSIIEIKEDAESRKSKREMKTSLEEIEEALINYNIDNFKKSDLKEYILDRLQKMKKDNNVEILTSFRKLLISYDLKFNRK